MMMLVSSDFAGINPLAILVSAIAGFAIGSVWYMALGKAWMNAIGKTEEEVKPKPGPFIAAFVMQLVMAFVLAGVIGHLGKIEFNIANGMLTALYCWAGFVLTTMFVNHRFQGSPMMLTVIDAGHWLFVLLAMGAIIGWFGA